MAENQKSGNKAITNFIKSILKHTILLIDRADNNNPLNGTGTFFKYNDNYFILTAKHVIENVDNNSLLICLGVPYQRYALMKEKVWTHNYLDLAYIQLNTTEVKFYCGLEIESFIINQKINQEINIHRYRHAICGYPHELIRHEKTRNLVSAKPYIITTLMLNPDNWPKNLTPIFDRPKNSKEDFLLILNKFARNPEGVFQEVKNIIGMSGAGIWMYDPETEKDKEPNYYLYGIQTGRFKNAWEGNSLISGSYIDIVIDQIKKDYK